MLLSPNQQSSSKSAYSHPNTNPRFNRLNVPVSHLSTYNTVSQLPLATPDDSDLDASSIVSARANTFSSNISSTNTVLHITPPQSRLERNTTLPPRLDEEENSTTLNAAPSITCTSSSVIFASRRPGSSIVRRSTFPRPLDIKPSGLHIKRIYRVTLLDGETVEVSLKKSATGLDLFNEVCQYLSLRERDYFGLYFFKQPSVTAAVTTTTITTTTAAAAAANGNVNATTASTSIVTSSSSFSHPFATTSSFSSRSRRKPWQAESAEQCAIHHRGVQFWLKPDRRIVDQCKKNTRFSFGVRIYPPKPHEDAYDELTRYLLCLQLRKDLLSGGLACSFFTYTLLAAYWAQAELGDWDLHVPCSSHSSDYLTRLGLAAPIPIGDGLSPEAEERLWISSRAGPPNPPPLVHLSASLLHQVALLHRGLRGLVPSRADLLFLQTAHKLATYGIDFHRIKDSTSSTVHVNLTRRLPMETLPRRSQSVRLKIRNRTRAHLSLPPSHRLSEFRPDKSLANPIPTSPCNSPSPSSDTLQQYPRFLGVFHGGIYVYRGRLRLEYHPWSAIVKMAYRRASFRLCLRLPDSEKDGLVRVVKYNCGTTALAKRIYRSCVDHHALFRLHRLEGGTIPTSWAAEDSFPFSTDTRLRRLHPAAASLSSTFASPLPSSPAATAPAAASPLGSLTIRASLPLDNRQRPLSEPDVRAPNAAAASLNRRGSHILRSAHKFFLRLFRKRSILPLCKTSQPLPIRHLHSSLSDQGLQQTVEADEQSTELGASTSADGFESASLSVTTAESTSPSISAFYTPSEWNRPPLPGPLWRMNPTDSSAGLFFEPSGGLTVARDWRLVIYQDEAEKTPSTEWRGCRATWGVSETSHSTSAVSHFGPRRLFFEVRLNGNEPVRIGWATENASLILGEDAHGFAYQTSSIPPSLNEDTLSEDWFKIASAEEDGGESQPHLGALVIGGASVDVIGSYQGDVIGCYLDLDARLAHWTKNGITAADMTISIARFPQNTVFFPACAIRNSSATFNFGDTPFAYGPMLLTGECSHSNWLPLASANLIAEIAGCNFASPAAANQMPIRLTPNPRIGWHLSPSNSPGSLLSPDRLCVRALLHSGWQTLHASKMISPSTQLSMKKPLHARSSLPSVYFEVRLLESLTTTPGAGVFMGFSTSSSAATTAVAATPAFPLGPNCTDTFGIIFEQSVSNHQTSLLHGGVKRPYGKALHKGDIIGCTLNPQSGLVFWSINGEYLGHIVQICASTSTFSTTTAADDVISIPLEMNQSDLTFNPLFCLANTSIEVNFGDGTMPLKHLNKHTNCIPLCYYQRLLDGDSFYWSLIHHLPPATLSPTHQTRLTSARKEASQSHYRHRSFAHCRASAGHNRPFVTSGVQKSASCISAPSAAAMNVAVTSDIVDSLTVLRSKIPLVPVKTGLWRKDSAERVQHRPITSPTFAAPWSRGNQVLPIVRTHRIAVSTLPPSSGIWETDIDDNLTLSDVAATAMALAVNTSLRRSASDSMQRTFIRHLCGHSEPSSVSDANQSSSSSLVERRMAQIPIVPTRIFHTRAYTTELPLLCLMNGLEDGGKTLKEKVNTVVETGEETISRQRHVTDLTLPPPTCEDDRCISSPPLGEVV